MQRLKSAALKQRKSNPDKSHSKQLGGMHLKMNHWPKRDPIKNYFPLPNEIFSLNLCPGEIVVYNYLLFCEDRKTYQCWPSYKTIGKAVGMGETTVRKYVGQLEEKSFIMTEQTSIITKDGRKRNGSLLYTILPIQGAIDAYYALQFRNADEEAERQRVAALLKVSNGEKGEDAWSTNC